MRGRRADVDAHRGQLDDVVGAEDGPIAGVVGDVEIPAVMVIRFAVAVRVRMRMRMRAMRMRMSVPDSGAIPVTGHGRGGHGPTGPGDAVARAGALPPLSSPRGYTACIESV